MLSFWPQDTNNLHLFFFLLRKVKIFENITKQFMFISLYIQGDQFNELFSATSKFWKSIYLWSCDNKSCFKSLAPLKKLHKEPLWKICYFSKIDEDEDGSKLRRVRKTCSLLAGSNNIRPTVQVMLGLPGGWPSSVWISNDRLYEGQSKRY